MNNVLRKNDLGLLYDPKRKNESFIAKKIQKKLMDQYKVRRNYPYLGISDGLTTSLRKMYSEKQYIGLEIEINQKIDDPNEITDHLFNALLENFALDLV